MSFRYEVLRSGEKSISKSWNADEILHLLEDGNTLISGAKDIYAQFGELSSIEQDLLTLASAIYASDRASPRGEREDYPRRIAIEVSLHNVDRFYPLIGLLKRVLRDLSQDGWDITFKQSKGRPDWGNRDDDECVETKKQGCVLLFSGGLDSLAAAIEFGAKEPLHLVSHVTMNRVTNKAQLELAKLLQAKSFVAHHSQVFVSSKNGGPTNVVHDAEPSQRTRSIVFMALGAIVGRRTGFHKILYMAENGQMAIHLPLSGGRIGAFSTHTAHPSVLAKMQTLLSRSLGIEFTLINPYVYLTKGEVVSHVVKNLPEGIPVSTSCWKNARLANHCGECVPCLIRRIALESNGGDSTEYQRDLFSEDIATLHEEDDGRRNFADISELVTRFSKGSKKELVDEFPDLISADFGTDMAIDMYKRFSQEAIAVLKRYPKLGPFLR